MLKYWQSGTFQQFSGEILVVHDFPTVTWLNIGSQGLSNSLVVKDWQSGTFQQVVVKGWQTGTF